MAQPKRSLELAKMALMKITGQCSYSENAQRLQAISKAKDEPPSEEEVKVVVRYVE
jgi:hypothetical protein